MELNGFELLAMKVIASARRAAAHLFMLRQENSPKKTHRPPPHRGIRWLPSYTYYKESGQFFKNPLHMAQITLQQPLLRKQEAQRAPVRQGTACLFWRH